MLIQILCPHLAHKLAAAGVGCIAASAKKQDCDAGALGAAIGESIVDYYIDNNMQDLINADLMPQNYLDNLTKKVSLATGVVSLLAGTDVDVAVNSAILAIENNGYYKSAEEVELSEGMLQAYAVAAGIVISPLGMAQTYHEYNNAKTDRERIQILVSLGFPAAKATKFATKFKVLERSCFVAGTLIETIDGLKPIETIQQGDLVWSRHEETLEYGYRPVTGTASFDDKEIYEVVVQDSNGNTETYQTTEEHPF